MGWGWRLLVFQHIECEHPGSLRELPAADGVDWAVVELELTAAGQVDPVFAGMAARLQVLQWHSVQVVEPPEGAMVLAQSPLCSNQAMWVGPRAWSMQYHMEVELDTVRNWGAVPSYRQSLEAAIGPGALEQMAVDAARALTNSPRRLTAFIAISPLHQGLKHKFSDVA